MFTGLIQEIGVIRSVEPRDGSGAADVRLVVAFRTLDRARLDLGASVCVDGVCLTVAELGADSFVWIGRYLVYGAMIVVPVWLVMRLMAMGRGRT